MDNHQHVNRRRRRNLPAELKVEIVDCFPVENAAHFLANVPSRLIIRHCAPRVRRMLKLIDQISTDYARTLPAPDSVGRIHLEIGRQYTPEMSIFLRYGAAHCNGFWTYRGIDGFAGYPADFFNNLIQYYYENKIPTKAVRSLIIKLSLENPAPWPAALVQPQAGQMNVEKIEVEDTIKRVMYILSNKHNPDIKFSVGIYFQGGAKCYEQMTQFFLHIVNLHKNQS